MPKTTTTTKPKPSRQPETASDLDPALQRRVVVENIRPRVNGGRFPVKRVIGEAVQVTADIFADGYDVLGAALLFRPAGDDTWREARMEATGNDEWHARFTVGALGRYEYAVEAWVDRFAS